MDLLRPIFVPRVNEAGNDKHNYWKKNIIKKKFVDWLKPSKSVINDAKKYIPGWKLCGSVIENCQDGNQS